MTFSQDNQMTRLRYEVAASRVEVLVCCRYVTQSGATERPSLSIDRPRHCHYASCN
jgi:hypothetical protein